MNPVSLRPARPEDEDEIVALLSLCELPGDDVASHLANFTLAVDGGRVVASVGLKLLGGIALLRSLAVRPEYRGRGLGKVLCDAIESEARTAGVLELWLLTTTAEVFFQRRGFRPTARSEVPEEIRGTQEFSCLCPDSAVCMRRTLDPPSPPQANPT